MAGGFVAESLLAGVVAVQGLERFCTVVTLMPKSAKVICAFALEPVPTD